MPRVLHLLSRDQRRGAESFALLLSDELARCGWDSSTAAVSGDAHEPVLGVPVLGRGWSDWRGLLAVRRECRVVDVVVAHGSVTLWSAALALLGTGVPFVYVNIGDPLHWSASRARQFRVSALLSRASAVAAISARSATTLSEHLGVPAGRVRVIPNARSEVRFAPAGEGRRRAARALVGVPEHAWMVAYVGALSEEKRVDLALEAVARLDGVHLVLAGTGPLAGELQAIGERLLPGRAHFLGRTDSPEDVLAAADALVLCSDSEGVPGVLIEAGLCGLPCVTTDVGYTGDVVLDGVTGAVVPPGDAAALAEGLQRALAQGPAWGAAAREHCEAVFGLRTVVDTWAELLTDVAAAASASRTGHTSR